jgi:hypothetical protein
MNSTDPSAKPTTIASVSPLNKVMPNVANSTAVSPRDAISNVAKASRSNMFQHTSASYRGSAQKMFELASQWAVHLALAQENRIGIRLSDYKQVQGAGKRRICVLSAAVYFVGAVSGKVTKIGRARTATTAIMAPGTMIQPVRCVRTWAT